MELYKRNKHALYNVGFYSVHKLKNTVKDLYVLMGQEFRDTEYVLTIELKDEKLLEYPGFPHNSSLLKLNGNEELNFYFEPDRDEIIVEGYFTKGDEISIPGKNFSIKPSAKKAMIAHYQEWMHVSFTFDGNKFDAKTTIYDDQWEKYCDYLEKGQLLKAIQLHLPDIGSFYECVDIFQPYVKAVHSKAAEAYKRGDHYAAAVIALSALHYPKVNSCLDNEQHYAIYGWEFWPGFKHHYLLRKKIRQSLTILLFILAMQVFTNCRYNCWMLLLNSIPLELLPI